MKLNVVDYKVKKALDLRPFGDIHFGSKECNIPVLEAHLESFKKIDDLAIILMGDLINCGTRVSVGAGTYDDDYNPEEQYEKMLKYLEPVSDKIIGAHCLTPKHEVLTKQGFKTYKELKEGDLVLSLKRNTEILEWKPIERILIREYSGQMFSFKSNCHQSKVTPNHTIIYYDRNNKFKEKLVKNIPYTIKIPVSGKQNGTNTSISTDFLKLIAWVITEGIIPKDRKDIHITQSKINEPNILEIKQVLKNLNIPYKVYEYKGRKNKVNEQDWINIWISAKHSKKVRDYLSNYKHHIPEEILYNSSLKEKEDFFDVLIKGDGWIYKVGNFINYGFATKSHKLATDFSVLCSLIGKRANINKRIRTLNGKKFVGYEIGVCNRNSVCLNKKNNYSEENYSGTVFDLCVKDNHNFFVRNSDRFFFTGNSGNHEERIRQLSSFDITKMMCRELNIPYLGYSALTKIKVNKLNFHVNSAHGSSGSGTPMGKMRNCMKMQNNADADIYLYGHTHGLDYNVQNYYRINNRGRYIEECTKHFVLTGSFVNWDGSYGEAKNYSMLPIGIPKIKLFGELSRGSKKVEVKFTDR